MSPADYPWYEEVAAAVPVLQGDIIEECPVLTFDPVPELPRGNVDESAIVAALEGSVAVQFVRAVVMTQACDLEHGHVRNVILCPVYYLNAEYRPRWEEYLAMLSDRQAEGGGLATPHLIVDFHEVFGVGFLNTVLQSRNTPRLRLCPPYREHLSQAFARFFTRVRPTAKHRSLVTHPRSEAVGWLNGLSLDIMWSTGRTDAPLYRHAVFGYFRGRRSADKERKHA